MVINTYAIPGIKTAKEIIAESFGIDEKKLTQKTRVREVVDARYFYFWYLRQVSKNSFQDIGEMCGGYNHATVIHGTRTAETLMKVDREYKFKAESALTNLKSIKQ
jgi:chromosomal replication initiation ATPase DnaA